MYTFGQNKITKNSLFAFTEYICAKVETQGDK